MAEDLKTTLEEIKRRITSIEEEMQRNRQIQENKESLAPRFVVSSPQTRTYSQLIENLFDPRRGMGMMGMLFQGDITIYIMGHFDQVILDKLIPIAKKIKIISPSDTVSRKKNKDALERLSKAGAEVRLHPMLHARLFCIPKTRFLIVGSGDIQTDCFGGSRFDAGITSNYPQAITDAMKFFDDVWSESNPFSDT
ncbi:MAG: hypothetical protein ABSF44_15740 [Candidatus Bathyarchaeia archaeon]|jgi:hypothetical protein